MLTKITTLGFFLKKRKAHFGCIAVCKALGQAGRKQISTLALSNEEASSSASGPAVI